MAIFDRSILLYGPWQEFERNTARLLMQAGWKDVRLVGRPGDGGADVLAVGREGATWVFQCKFSGTKATSKDAIDEVRNAGRLYGADGLCVVTSRPPARSFFAEIQRLRALGLNIRHLGPTELETYDRKLPLYAPGRHDLRDYQLDALESLRAAMLGNGRGLIVLATGLGKTVIVAELVDDLLSSELLGAGRVLVLAHTVPLIDQLLVSFWRHLPKTIPTHRLASGERPRSFEGITFATIQSFSRLLDPPFFDLVIVDEAHHLGAPGYLDTLEQLDPPRIIGVTATPWRAEGVSITHVLGNPVFSMGIKEGLEQGYLSNVDYRIYVDGIDWEFVKEQSQHGYTIAQLNKKLIIPSRDEEAIRIIREAFELQGRSRGLVFSPSQIHARNFASDLRRNGFSAASLTSSDDTYTRYQRIAQFAAGNIQFLCVVDIFNEGIDVPDVDILVFLRVTHSRRIFVQQLGRGLRITPDKEDVLVLDFAADVRRIHAALDLASATDGEGIERLQMSHAMISFTDRSLGSFFYEWIADLGNIQDVEEDELIRLPVIDLDRFNFPDPLV